MINKYLAYPLALALIAGLGITGCKKHQEPGAPLPTQPTPTAPAAAQQAPATVSVSGIALGNAIDENDRVTTSTALFKPTDTVYLSVITKTSDPEAQVSGNLGAKWTYQDGQVVNDDSRTIEFSDEDATAFSISKDDGFPQGQYRVEVTLNGDLIQVREFDVQ